MWLTLQPAIFRFIARREHYDLQNALVYTPGPTPLLPAAQFAMAAADIHHRTPEFRALFCRKFWPS
jgi:hypothetical protein